MKNLKHCETPSYEFVKEVIHAKQDTQLKVFFSTIDERLKSACNTYDDKFLNKKLNQINESNYNNTQKEYFSALYSYRLKKIKWLLDEINKLQDRAIRDTCPYCTINQHSTFDHFLPECNYYEYIVHPKNLVPCCYDCNNLKGNRKGLNLYLDQLPEEQYLFADVDFISIKEPKFTFYLMNINNINQALFEKLKLHYESLNLLYRMKKAANKSYSTFWSNISKHLKRQNWEEVKAIAMEANNENKLFLGNNHWECILTESILTNTSFALIAHKYHLQNKAECLS